MYQNAFHETTAQNFKPEDLARLLFGDSFQLYGDKPSQYDSAAEPIYVHLSLKNDSGICPDCGRKSCHLHEKRWECPHSECSTQTFPSSFPEADAYAHRSLALNLLIFSIALFCSASAAALVCQGLGIRVSDDSILRLYKRIEIKDDPDVEFIGLDDVAIKKGQVYSTLIYDGNTHHILAMLDGRDGKALKEWLKGHTKTKGIARNRASVHAKAISKVLPDCLQVADKFHLFLNLMRYLKDVFKAELPSRFFIKNGEEVMESVQKTWDWLEPMDLGQVKELNDDNTAPVDENGNEIKLEHKKRDPNCKQYKEQAKTE